MSQVVLVRKTLFECQNYDHCNGEARTLKKLRTSKGDYWMQRFSSIAPLYKMGTSYRKEFASRGSELFPLRAVPCGMEKQITTLGDLSLMLLFFYARA